LLIHRVSRTAFEPSCSSGLDTSWTDLSAQRLVYCPRLTRQAPPLLQRHGLTSFNDPLRFSLTSSCPKAGLLIFRSLFTFKGFVLAGKTPTDLLRVYVG
jgi:hypothetical protein